MNRKKKHSTYAFIDASNLFYGGERSLGWKIDYRKLIDYFRRKYSVNRVLYFGGVYIYDFPYDYQSQDRVNVRLLKEYLVKNLESNDMTETKRLDMMKNLQKVRFYSKLLEFGYELYIKPVKTYTQNDGVIRHKANCDVDMAFHLMKEVPNFDRILFLSGDGDFLAVLKHIKEIGKEIVVIARGNRTAREILKFAGGEFKDFEYMREVIRML